MNAFKQFRRDERGAAAIEFAIAAQVLVALIWGIFQVGLVFQANAGMQHALGEAARLAVIYPYPGNTALTSKVTAKKFGTYNGTLSALSITDVTQTTGSGATAVTKTVGKDLTLTYDQKLNFLFIPGPTVHLSRSKRVWLAA